ncbi:hypothetical protein PLCT2_02972 [Planctomycetaceae bacterium]|nr:hypothetical protein PLCT2_02972 [Planctomycetaceae bacterium]
MHEEVELTKGQASTIAIPKDLRNVHSLVKQTMRGFRGVAPGWDGIVSYEGRPGFAVYVSRKLFRRAMLISHAFITAVESRGHKVVQSTNESLSARLLVCGSEVLFEVRESVLKLPRGFDAQGQPRFLFRPSGSLSLCMHARFGQSRRLRDGRTFKLETRLDRAVPELERIAKVAFQRQDDWRQEEHRREAAWRRSELQEKARNRRSILLSALQSLVNRTAIVDAGLAQLALFEADPMFSRTRYGKELIQLLRFATRRLQSPRLLHELVPKAAWQLLPIRPVN